MIDFSIPGGITLAQIPARQFTGMSEMAIETLLTMYEETLDEIRLVSPGDFAAAEKKNGHSAVDRALRNMGIDPVIESQKRERAPPYCDAGMYSNETRRRFMGVK
jgi:hypothetical protein